MAVGGRSAGRWVLFALLAALAVSALVRPSAAQAQQEQQGQPQQKQQGQQQQKPQAQQKPPQLPTGSGDQPQTCCRCKCVVPSKQPSTPAGMVGAIGPTYSTKQMCKSGFLSSCDAVCLQNMGTWTAYYSC